MSKNVGLEKLEKTVFEETIRSGCQMASAGLSVLLGIPIKVSGVVMGFVPISEVVFLTENPEGIVMAAQVTLSGKISGHLIFMLTPRSWEACKELLKIYTPGTDIEISAFAELANIACSSFISKLSDLLGIPISFTPPQTLEEMMATVLEGTLIEQSESSDLLTVETTFESRETAFKGFLIFIPSEESVKIMLAQFMKNHWRSKP